MSARAVTVAVLALSALACADARAAEPIFTRDGLAVSGHDPVAYFTDGKPVAGQAEFEAEWSGVRWRFASAAHQATFLADPAKYAPQFGGYCAYAVSRGYVYETSPQAWKVVDGKLYLNYDLDVKAKWEAELPDAIGKANANWPAVLQKK